MRRRRNMYQMKEQDKTPEQERNKMETSFLPDTEFKTLAIKMLNELSKNFNKEIENIKKETENIKSQSK